MELRQLRYFVAVAETGNISHAAKKIFLTQPALSRQIKALEVEIGHCLLERSAHAIRLTAIGERFLVEARELIRHADEILERTRTSANGVRLRVGYAPSLASGILSAAVDQFKQSQPSAKVELSDLSTLEMIRGLEEDKLDLILTVGQVAVGRRIKWLPLTRAEWRVALNHKHPLSIRKRLKPANLAGQSLLVYSRSEYPEYWETVSGWMKEHALQIPISGEFDGSESLMAAVEAGLGVALTTTRSAHQFPRRVQFRPISPQPKSVCIAAGIRADRQVNRPLEILIAEMRKAASELSGPLHAGKR
jgi:DNA-binding transcriptional LysR family regulator